MPRISRRAVEFQVGEDTYLAMFSHQHGDHEVDVNGVNTRVKHTTTCLLGKKGGSGFTGGDAHCSRKDIYDWRRGIKVAFERAL